MSQWGMSMEQAAALPERHAVHLLGAYKERMKYEGVAGLIAQAEASKPKPPSLGQLSALGVKIKDGRQ